MPVLVEAISVIVRRDAIDRSCPGGWKGFLSLVPNGTLCMDAQIARVGFMNPIDVRGFAAILVKNGLTAMTPSNSFADFVVIDQHSGPTAPCDWIEYLRIPFETGTIGLARLKGNTDTTLVCPQGWTFLTSLSHSSTFRPGVEPGDDYEFIRTQNGVDVYRHKTTGREVFVGRTTPP